MKSGTRLALLAFVALSACGSNLDQGELSTPAKIFAKSLTVGRNPSTAVAANPAATLAFRAGLQQAGQPILAVSNTALKYGNFMAPFGKNGDVETWSSTTFEQVSLRGGMLIATRGFGPDLMSSSGPSVATISAARGSTKRQMYFLDGGDKPVAVSYTCTLSPADAESVEILAKSYATRKVNEACTGGNGAFTNEFWFDHGANIRQSRQYIAPGLDGLLIQRVID